ncbi:MAG: GLPGLI family protein [Marinifilum sp.]|jgi:GLPGLI family protein|nr:GLPGLI family protein [Marinifilum sp.]
MKNYLFALLVLFAIATTKGHAQEKELYVIYDMVDQSMHGINFKYELRSRNGKGLCSGLYKPYGFRATVQGSAIGSMQVNSEPRQEKSQKEEEDFKDYKRRDMVFTNQETRELYFLENIGLNTIIKEELNLFQWQMLPETDSILGYKCQKAKTEFRGRKYTAWFSTQLPFKAAPWKIHGLPGVVLKVETDDGYLKYTAIQLKIRKSEGEIKNPFQNKKNISWEEFSDIYKKTRTGAEEKAKAYCAKNNIPYNPAMILAPRIEIIIEELNRVSLQDMTKAFRSQVGH